MANIVLVHGAWLGGWVWKLVAPALRQAGHHVFTPTLTGLGERVHLAHPGIGLDTHILDIVNLLEFEDLYEVMLVGHSYSGIVITGAADVVPQRLQNLVYLDAFVPADGQSLHDLVPPGAGDYNRALAQAQGDGWRMPLEDRWRTGTEENLRWMNPRWTDQPLKTFEQPVQLGNTAAAGLRRVYIHCIRDTEHDMMIPFARHAAESPAWELYELPAEHTPMVTLPDALATLLLELAAEHSRKATP